MSLTISMKVKTLTIIAILLTSLNVSAQEGVRNFLVRYINGSYHLIGKALDSDQTYYGNITFEYSESGIKVTQRVNGTSIIGKAAIEKATADKVDVLRIRFEEKGTKYEETCMIDGDLDNYARITCYLYKPGVRTMNPGLEAFFIYHKRK